MLETILSFVQGIFKPAVDLADELHTSDEERLTLKAKMMQIEASVSAKLVEYASLIAELQAKIIQAETASGSWLTKSWRPLVMLNFVLLINMYWFGYQPVNLSEDTIHMLLDIVKWGLSGYVVGRSVEKTATTVANAIKAKQ